jgi:hypothetical protein
MEALKIWILCVAAAIAYGVVHDQITVRICYEYFSVFHPTILPLKSPTLLALQWGIAATWWVGAALGVALVIAARGGSRKPVVARDLYRPIRLLLVSMAVGAIIAGVIGFFLAKNGFVSAAWLSPLLPVEKHARFMADWWAHAASYFVGIVGGLILCIQTYLKRAPERISLSPTPPPTPA